MLKREKGRPVNVSDRLAKEVRVYDLLDHLGIDYERVDHSAAMTMEDCEEIDRVLDATICKNLLLCKLQGKQNRRSISCPENLSQWTVTTLRLMYPMRLPK